MYNLSWYNLVNSGVGRCLLVEAPSNEEVDSVVEGGVEERWLRRADVGQRRHNRHNLPDTVNLICKHV